MLGKPRVNFTEIPFKRLTDKELAEKKARNESFLCNEKFYRVINVSNDNFIELN